MGIFKKLMKKRPSTKAAGGIKKSLRKERDIPKVPRGEKKPGVQPKKPAKPGIKRPNLPSGTRGASAGGGGIRVSAPTGNLKATSPKKSEKQKKPLMATPIEPNNIGKKKVKKGPGFKAGGMASKGYRNGGVVKSKGAKRGGKRRGVGAAIKGFGKVI